MYRSAAGGRIAADEARFQAAAQHPNLMPLYDAGTDPLHGVAYLVMPHYPGADLADTLERFGKMPFRAATQCADQLCGALAFLHERRHTAHGDVKPANVWLTQSGAALLLDFSLFGVRVREGAGRAGTPGFTAPEALAGREEPRSDLFSLGCLLYTCLAGEPPFADDAAVQRGRFTALGRLRADIRPELEAVVHTALAPDPERRFRSARELQTALRRPHLVRAGWWGAGRALGRRAWRAAQGVGSLLRRGGRWYYRVVRRRPAAVLLATGAALLVSGGLVFAAFAWAETHRSLMIAFGLGAAASTGLRLGLQCRFRTSRREPTGGRAVQETMRR